MQYINKNTGEVAAHLNFGTHTNTWEVYPSNNNRYRVLYGNSFSEVEAIDLNIAAGLIKVGELLPGYNRVIQSIEHCVGDDGNEFFEVTC
jgi:hypothetical protein